jgi:glycosyltransferase involved in cell wall biosynthesis
VHDVGIRGDRGRGLEQRMVAALDVDCPDTTVGSPGRLNDSPVMRLVYLSPTYHPYRVPVFEALYRRVGPGFAVVSLKTQPTHNDRLAQTMGTYSRRLVPGRMIPLAAGYAAGRQTPASLLLAPTFPLALLRARPEVVISNNFNLWTLTSILLRYRTVIFWEGTPHTERTVKQRRRALRRWMAARARAFVVNGSLARRYVIEELGVPAERVFTGGMVASPPPPGLAGGEPRRVAPGEPVRFLFVGRLVPGKGVSRLVEAAARLRERLGPAARFAVEIVGDGPERTDLARFVAEHDLAEHVHFAGAVPPEDVWEYYGHAHVFVLPTFQDNWPLVVPEAMSMGCAVLLSLFAGSAPDLIDDGGNGHVLEPDDTGRLADLMAEYVASPELVERHGRRSRELVAPYGPESAADAYLAAVRVACR